jgi:hypothetical protein
MREKTERIAPESSFSSMHSASAQNGHRLGRMPIARRTLAFILLFLGLWLLSGCFYLPLPRRRTDKRQTDFRDYIGAPESKRPIRRGTIDRARVLALLGSPEYASSDGQSIAYIMYTEGDVWVWPLCFAANPAKSRVYGLRLDFDSDQRLLAWTMLHEEQRFPPLSMAGHPRDSELLRRLSPEGKPLLPLSATPLKNLQPPPR